MPRRSSISGSTPSRMTPPSRASAGGSSSSVRSSSLAQIGQVVEFGGEAAHERRLELVEQHANAGHGGKRLPERDEIPRAGGTECGAGNEPLDVVDRFQRVAHLGALGAPEGELLDRVETILNPIERHQRPKQPGAEQAPAHRGDRPIDLVEQRSSTAAVSCVDDLEIPERGRIDDHAVGGGPKRNLADVREVRLLGVAQVLHQRAGRAGGGGAIVEPEPVQRLRLHLGQQRCAVPPRTRTSIHPRPSPAPRAAIPRSRVGDVGEGRRRNHFARAQHREFVGQCLARIRPGILRRREFPGGQIEQGDAVPRCR